MKKLKLVFIVLCIGGVVSCGEKQDIKIPVDEIPSHAVEKLVTIDASTTFQTIAGFGASDAWQPAWVGKHWTESRDRISELLFSRDIGEGQPKGIGLSMWRVNLGAGSAEQGNNSGIETISRRAESYLKENGVYDWNSSEGQRYFMQRALQLGVEKFILFSNSPLVQYTYNGEAHSVR